MIYNTYLKIYKNIYDNNIKKININIHEYKNIFIKINDNTLIKKIIKKSNFLRNLGTRKIINLIDLDFYINKINPLNFIEVYKKYNIPTFLIYSNDSQLENQIYNYFKYINSVFIKKYNIDMNNFDNVIQYIDDIINLHETRFDAPAFVIDNSFFDENIIKSFVNVSKKTEYVFIYIDFNNNININNLYEYIDYLNISNIHIILKKNDNIYINTDYIHKNKTYIINDVNYIFEYEVSQQNVETEFNKQQAVIKYIKSNIIHEIDKYSGIGYNIDNIYENDFYYNYIFDTIYQFYENYNYPLSYNTIKIPDVDNFTIKYNENREIYADGNNINAGKVNNKIVNNQATTNTLWTSDKILNYIDEKIRNLRPPDNETIKINNNNKMYVDENLINAGFVKGYKVDITNNNALWNGIKIIDEIIKIANNTLWSELNKIDNRTIIFDENVGRLSVNKNTVDLKSISGYSVDFSYVNINILTINNDYKLPDNKLITSNTLTFYLFKEMHINLAYENSKYLTPTARYFVYDNLNNHSNPLINDIVYETSTNKLYKYIRKNKWIELEWIKYIKSTDDYRSGFLIIDNENNLYVNKNYIDENSNELVKIYPLIGANNFFINNSNLLYYLPTGKGIYYKLLFNVNTNIPIVVNPYNNIIDISKSIIPAFVLNENELYYTHCYHINYATKTNEPYFYIETTNDVKINKLYSILNITARNCSIYYCIKKEDKYICKNKNITYKYDKNNVKYINNTLNNTVFFINKKIISTNYLYNENINLKMEGYNIFYNRIYSYNNISKHLEFYSFYNDFNNYEINNIKYLINEFIFKNYYYHDYYAGKPIIRIYKFFDYFNQNQLIHIKKIL